MRRILISACILGLAGPLTCPDVAASSGTSGRARVGVTFASPATSDIVDPVLAADSIATDNGQGASATATYAASLASATLSTDVGATADPANIGSNEAQAEVDALSFFEQLNFLIPAGTYAEPVVLRLHGFSLGSLFSQGCTSPAGVTCSNGYHSLNLHAGSGYGQADFSRRVDVNAGLIAAGSFDARFTLELPILNPTTLVQPLQSAVALTGSLITKGIALGTTGHPTGAEKTMFAGDAFAGFSAIEVPRGITWISDSGLFLTQPVPEPASYALLVAGLAGLAWRRRPR